MITWNLRYRVKSYIRNALWIIPLYAVLLEQLIWRVTHELDHQLNWRGLGLGIRGADALFGAATTLTLSFFVFTFGSLLVAIQVAGGQYTPRIIATTLLRDNVIRYTVGIFVFTFLFSVKSSARMETDVRQLVAFVTVLLGLTCIVAFLYLIDHAAKMLRPVSLVKRIGDDGLVVVESMYPERFRETKNAASPEPNRGAAERMVIHRGKSAIVIAVNMKTIIAEAEKANRLIEFAPEVGDFVAKGEPLFRLYSGTGAVDENKLRASVVFGGERTIEQDPLFAFRILVDIGIKALSKAINDPTTAVLAIDQLQRLLKSAGMRNLRADEIYDDSGNLRVIFRTPNWEDFVNLAFTEIRYYGAENIQIARRLRAMIFNLREALPVQRHPALNEELKLLDRAIEKVYILPEDLKLARIPDPQGLGGSANADLHKSARHPHLYGP